MFGSGQGEILFLILRMYIHHIMMLPCLHDWFCIISYHGYCVGLSFGVDIPTEAELFKLLRV